MSSEPAIKVQNLTKRFGATVANEGIDLTVGAGELHGLLGENGAGKSTAVRAIAGSVAPDEGTIAIHGRSLPLGSPVAAIRAGVGLVAQHFALVETLTVWENIALGVEPGRWGLLDRSRARRHAGSLIDQIGADLRIDDRIEDLTVGNRQIVEILKILGRDSSVLVLDEPTSTLSPVESEWLFAFLRRILDGGTTVLLVTHRIQDILDYADRATVLRQGRVVHRSQRGTWNENELVDAIVGETNVERNVFASTSGSRLQLRAAGLSTNQAGIRNLDRVSLEVDEGTLVGVAGVAGNGQETLIRALAGLVPHEGRIVLADTDITDHTAGQRRRDGIAYIPEDRHAEGMVAPFSVVDNVVLGDHTRYGHRFLLDRNRVRRRSAELIQGYNVRGSGLDAPMAALSGGNQQKVVVARALSSQPRLVVAGQPTRGLDIGAAAEVRRRLVEVAQRGGSVIVTSADLDELFDLCHRIVVLYAGRVAGQLDRNAFDTGRVARMMTVGRDSL